MLASLPLPKARLESLTDGIFAVSMTLLVLDLRFPEPSIVDSQGLARTLLAMLPRLDDYVISFAVLCVFWLAHLRLLRRVREVDAAFTALNLAFLLFTTFVPPLTAFLEQHATHPRAAIVYGVNLIIVLACEALMWRHAMQVLSNETVTDAPAVWRFARRRFGFAAGVVAAGILVALIETRYGTASGVAPYIYLLLIATGLVRPRDPAPG